MLILWDPVDVLSYTTRLVLTIAFKKEYSSSFFIQDDNSVMMSSIVVSMIL